MKKYLFFAIFASLLMTSCVTLGKYEDLESRYNQTVKDRNLAKRELTELKEENAELQRLNQSLSVNAQDLAAAKARNERSIDYKQIQIFVLVLHTKVYYKANKLIRYFTINLLA